LLAPYHSQSRIFWSFLLGRELGVRGGVAFWYIFVETHSVGEGRFRSQEWSGLLTYLCRNIYTNLQKPPAYQPCGILKQTPGGHNLWSCPSLYRMGSTVLSWGMGTLAHFVFWSPRPNNMIPKKRA
jgi:hypothetical protein